MESGEMLWETSNAGWIGVEWIIVVMSGKKMVPDDATSAASNAWFDGTGIGKSYESETIDGTPVLRNRWNTRTLEVSPEFDTGSVWKFTTIAAAVTQATVLAPSSTNPVKIVLHAGLHVLAASVSVPTYCMIEGQGIDCTVVSYTAAGSRFVMGTFAAIRNCWLAGNVTATVGVSQITAGSTVYIDGCYFTGFTTNSILLSNVSAMTSYIHNCLITNAVGSINHINIGHPGTVYLYNSIIYSTFIAVLVFGGTTVNIRSCRFQSLTSAVTVSTALANVTIVGSTFESCTTALSLGGSWAHVLSVTGCSFKDTSTSHIALGAVSSLYTVDVSGCQWFYRDPITNMLPAAGSRTLTNFTWQEQDKCNTVGLHTSRALSMGWRDEGGDLYTCKGGPSQGGTICASYNTSGVLQTLDSANRLLTIGASTSFPNLALATLGYEIVGEKTPFSGFVYNVTTAGDVSPGDFSIEYLGAGAVWTDFTFSVIPLSGAYEYAGEYGDLYPADSVGSRLGERLCLFSTDLLRSQLSPAWTSQTYGANAARYWIRVRKLDNTWAVRSLISYLYTLSDTAIFTKLGRSIRLGATQSWKTLPLSWASMYGTALTLPNDTSLWCGSVMNITTPRANFAVADTLGTYFYLPSDLDVSTDIELVLAYLSDNTGAAQDDFSLQITWATISTGRLMTIVAGVDPSNQQSLALACPVDSTNGMNVIQKHAKLSVPAGICRAKENDDTDLFIFQLTRNADTNANGMVVLAVDIRYISFIDGNPVT